MAAKIFLLATARDAALACHAGSSHGGYLPVAAGVAGGAIGLPCEPVRQPARPWIAPASPAPVVHLGTRRPFD